MAKNATKTSSNVPAVVEPEHNAVPAFLQNYSGDAGAGVQNVDTTQLPVPRIMLLHSNSEKVEEGLAEPGHYWHTLLGLDLGETVRVVPIFYEEGYTLWDPAPNAKEVLARGRKVNGVWVWEPSHTKFQVKIGKQAAVWDTAGSIDESKLAKWGKDNEPPPAKKSHNFLFALPQVEDGSIVGVMSFQKSAFPVGTDLAQKLIARRSKFPSFAFQFDLGVGTGTNKDGQKFLIPKIQPAGMVQDEKEYIKFREMYEAIKGIGLSGFSPDQEEERSGDAPTSTGAINIKDF